VAVKRPRSTLLGAGLALGVLAVTAASGGNEPGAPPALRLRSAAAVEPESKEDPVLAVLRVAPGAVATLRARLAADGVRVLAYLPDDALLVERAGMDASAMVGVATSEPWRAERAVTPELASLDRARAVLFPGGVPILVGVARAEDLANLADRLQGLGARVRWSAPSAAIPQLGLLADPDRLPAALDALKATAGLAWADVQPPVRLANGDAVWRCQSGVEGATPLFDRGLLGQGQIVGIMDTGIDIDHCAFQDDAAGLPALNDDLSVVVDPDHRKVLAVDFYWWQDWPNPGAFDWDDQGHGSHVAGSVAGDAGGDVVHQGADGMAPAARLVIQDGGYAVDDCADLPGLGCPVRPLEPVLQQAWDQGARLHTNSWGDEENFRPHNRYTERAADVDRFVWEHPEMTVLFAAGNAGQEGDDTVISPATSKNVIAVGASWRADVEPPCPTEWSSRGFAHDGRIKPDIMAPGASLISVETDFVVGAQSCEYGPKSGTSMATPVTAGHATLVRQYFVDGFYPGGSPDPGTGFTPSAALIKAMLIASAVDLAELGCPLAEPVPSRDQGWGIIQLDRVLLFEGAESRLQVDDERGGFAASSDPPLRRELSVGVDGPLKVVLVWTDPPSTSLAAVNLVNDIDLVVEGPDGTLLGNQLVEGISQPGGSADRLNNVEVVWLPEALPGEWTIEVRPHAIREAGQGFALVVLSPPPAVEPRRARGRLAPGP
jgi:hypothetical protein